MIWSEIGFGSSVIDSSGSSTSPEATKLVVADQLLVLGVQTR